MAVESTYKRYWLVDGLQEEGLNGRLDNPAKMDQFSGIKVTDDASDAGWMAELLRLVLLPQAASIPWSCDRSGARCDGEC